MHSGNIKQLMKTIDEILNKSSNKNKSIEIKAENGEMLDARWNIYSRHVF